MDNHQTALCAAVESHRREIFAAERYIWTHAETGFKEWETSAYLEKAFEDMGYSLTRAGNIPGFYTDIDTGRKGPKVLVMAELDAIINFEHPEARENTGAVHACGHNAQCAAMLGIAHALRENGALQDLSGSIRLMLVPAEELIEIAYREELRKKGVIHYYGGKIEFMYRGFMRDVDMAIMVHTKNAENSSASYFCMGGMNGFIAKSFAFEGKSAHAGSPHTGINALNAASLGMQAINSIRETFRDEDCIRVHPITTEGCGVVNVVPSRVPMECYVRGKTMPAIISANTGVNRALAGAALALGANVMLQDRPGYFPMTNNPNLVEILRECGTAIAGNDGIKITLETWGKGSSDMGDVSAVMPAIHPNSAGAGGGGGHSAAYMIADPEKACVNSAKLQALMVHTLLKNDAERARDVLARATPPFASQEEYFRAVDALFLDQKAISYQGNEASAVFGN